MSIFNKKLEEKQEAAAANLNNTIGKGTIVTGDIEAYGNLRIEGKIIGDLRSKSKVVLGNGSYVEGNVTAQNAEIEGEVKGKIEITDILFLRSTAVIKGDVFAAKIVTEPGAKMSGRVEIGGVSNGNPTLKSSSNGSMNGKKLEASV